MTFIKILPSKPTVSDPSPFPVTRPSCGWSLTEFKTVISKLGIINLYCISRTGMIQLLDCTKTSGQGIYSDGSPAWTTLHKSLGSLQLPLPRDKSAVLFAHTLFACTLDWTGPEKAQFSERRGDSREEAEKVLQCIFVLSSSPLISALIPFTGAFL